jgi:hypothetical protein
VTCPVISGMLKGLPLKLGISGVQEKCTEGKINTTADLARGRKYIARREPQKACLCGVVLAEVHLPGSSFLNQVTCSPATGNMAGSGLMAQSFSVF